MSTRFRITMWVLLLIFLPIGLLAAVANGLLVSPVGLAIGTPIELAYGVVVVVLFRLLAQWPFAGWKWVVACLGGGVGCCALVLLVGHPMMMLTEKLGWDAAAMSLGGAYPEEIVKATCVVIILLSFRELDRPWHGFITGAMVGLGFEVLENIMYSAMGALLSPNSDAAGSFLVALVRIVAGPGLHIMFTSIAGWGLALALFNGRLTSLQRWGTAIGWFAISFGLHFTWNLLPESEFWQYGTFVVAGAIGYPLWIWLAVKGHREAKRDIARRQQWHAPRNPRVARYAAAVAQ